MMQIFYLILNISICLGYADFMLLLCSLLEPCCCHYISTHRHCSMTGPFIIYVIGAKIGLRKRQRHSDAFVVFGVLAWMPADAQTNCGNSDVHVQWFSYWKIRADDHDIMK